MPDNLGPAGTYTVVGNQPCNTAPVAALSANPISGDPPLLVHFNASASSDPDTGDTIASYQFDFGDGTTATCPGNAACTGTGTVDHTYQSNGHFHATVRVTDNHGLISSNVAGVEIEVELPLDRTVSRKAHNNVPGSPFDVILYDPVVYPNGTGEVECRTVGPENDYTIIYTFGTEFKVTGAATTVTVDGAMTNVNSHGPYPAPGTNQYQVHVKNTVANAQYHQIVVDGIPVTNSNKASAPATLKNVSTQLALLQGDVNGSKVVTTTDVQAVQAKTLKPVTTATFRLDVNASGTITTTDVQAVQAKTLTRLP
jgi:PKD repeat protein